MCQEKRGPRSSTDPLSNMAAEPWRWLGALLMANAMAAALQPDLPLQVGGCHQFEIRTYEPNVNDSNWNDGMCEQENNFNFHHVLPNESSSIDINVNFKYDQDKTYDVMSHEAPADGALQVSGWKSMEW